MKLRSLFVLAILAALLSACNFTLAADVTPPPDYVPPTLLPPVAQYPANPPDIKDGESIYLEKCVPCHGTTGMGDGPQGKQLPVTVAAIGLPDFARTALLSAWYKQVTMGNISRYMPPFASLTDQQRWNVAAYAYTLHATPDQIQKGKALFEAKCADCAKYFSNPEKMYGLSEDALVALIRQGEGDLPAFGKDFSDDEATAVAMYIRTLTFSAPQAEPTATATLASTATLAATPSTAETPTPESGTPAATAEVGTPAATAVTPVDATPATAGVTPTTVVTGTVKGSIENKTGKPLPAGTKITLYGYEHSGDPSEGPKEVLKLEGTIKPDDSYSFENVQVTENLIFVAEVQFGGVNYDTNFTTVKAGVTVVELPKVAVYDVTTDLSKLTVDNVAIRFDFSKFGQINAGIIYSIYNKSDKTVYAKFENNNQEIPFIKTPANATVTGLQATQDSARFISNADQTGFYIQPSEQAYGLVMIINMPKSDTTEFSQKFVLPVGTVRALVPEGVTISSEKFTKEEPATPPDANGQPTPLQLYSLKDVKANDTVTFTISGEPKTDTPVNPNASENNNALLIGAGAFGLVLVMVGAWLFLRDRNKSAEDEEDEDGGNAETASEFEDSESLMDAIIALDDLHRSGKITDEAYQKRREELKKQLKK